MENEIIKKKYETQKQLYEEANGDLKTYFENTHKYVLEIEREKGIQFHYSESKVGFTLSLPPNLRE